ncbi:MAG: dTMP kinase [Blastochloris viridis]|uniref:Thymidylate kinase n=1 Tax=Blastochloris viridis TaxID=1079 RepID=A0A6N4RE77_BLAVI|nr:MAG: dTMP kinase [Blastochloris viridis]
MTGFIVLEGGEGAGKSTQARLLTPWLTEVTGIACHQTVDPGGTDLGWQMRKLIMEDTFANITPVEHMTLFGVAKMALAHEHIAAARKAGEWLISDRFQFGSPVYQGYVNKEDTEWEYFVRYYTEKLIGNAWPDLTLVLDVPPEIGLNRKQRSGEKLNLFDEKSIRFHRKVRKGYLHYAKLYANRGTVVINANRPLEKVTTDIQRAISSHFALAA